MGLIALALSWMAAAAPPDLSPQPQATDPGATPEAVWGIRPVALRPTLGGRMLDFRYRVLAPAKGLALGPPLVKAAVGVLAALLLGGCATSLRQLMPTPTLYQLPGGQPVFDRAKQTQQSPTPDLDLLFITNGKRPRKSGTGGKAVEKGPGSITSLDRGQRVGQGVHHSPPDAVSTRAASIANDEIPSLPHPTGCRRNSDQQLLTLSGH